MVAEKLRNVAKWLRNGCDPLAAATELTLIASGVAEDGTGYSQQTVDALSKERDALAAQLAAVSAAIGGNEFMDPPDGGSVTLAEQVKRLRADYDALAARLAKAAVTEENLHKRINEWAAHCDVIEAQNADLRERLAAAESREVCTVAHDDVETCGYCQRDVIAARLAEAERDLAEAERDADTLLGMIRHQRDVLRECLPYLNESMAGKRPGRSADDIRAAVKALTSASADGPKGEK